LFAKRGEEMDWRGTKTFKICSLPSLVVLKGRKKVLWSTLTFLKKHD